MTRQLPNAIGSTVLAMLCSFCDWFVAIGIFTCKSRTSRLAASRFNAATFAAPKQAISRVDADEVAAVVALAALLKHLVMWKLTGLAQDVLLERAFGISLAQSRAHLGNDRQNKPADKSFASCPSGIEVDCANQRLQHVGAQRLARTIIEGAQAGRIGANELHEAKF